MAATATRRIALFSIKPAYAQAILDGRKHVEFRRTALSPDVAHVVVYSTSPVQRVVGTFEVDGVDNEPPDVLWDRYSNVGGIARDAYDRYFAGCTSAYAIRVRRPVTLPLPIQLADVRQGLRAPQSFQYLDDEAASRVDLRLLPVAPGSCEHLEPGHSPEASPAVVLGLVLTQLNRAVQRIVG